MRINTNVSSLTAQEAAQNTSKSITGSLEKLSTGFRINKASDDASGLAIADKLRTQATSINQGISNGNSAVTLLQIADKSMAEQSNILDTIKAKLVQANTDTTSADGRESIRKDITKLLEQLDNIAKQTNYNGNVLLQSSSTEKYASNKLNFQIGESKNDIISNSNIQSNTNGLGGGTETYAASGKRSKLDTGTIYEFNKGAFTINTVSGPALSATAGNVTGATGKSSEFELIGKVGQLSVASGTITFSNLDSETAKRFQALVDSNTSGIATGGEGTFVVTITGGSATGISGMLNFGDAFIAKMTVKVSGSSSGVSINSSGAVKIKDLDTDKGNTDLLTIKGSNVTGGEMLESLSKLTENGLTKDMASKFQSVVDTAITDLNNFRGDIGSTQNQVESAVRNLMTQATNVKAAESIIRDVDYAAESANFNKQNIISQAGSYAISQANAVQQNVLRLLQ